MGARSSVAGFALYIICVDARVFISTLTNVLVLTAAAVS